MLVDANIYVRRWNRRSGVCVVGRSGSSGDIQHVSVVSFDSAEKGFVIRMEEQIGAVIFHQIVLENGTIMKGNHREHGRSGLVKPLWKRHGTHMADKYEKE